MSAASLRRSRAEATTASSDLVWEAVRFSYPQRAERVLNGVDLKIEPGELTVVMGRSGCGKSTLALTLNGIVPRVTGGVFEGRVVVFAVEPSERELHELAQLVGIVFQDPDAQLCTMTARDEITFGPQNLLVDKEEILRRLDEVSQLVGMNERLNDPVFTLSGGQKQRVAIASVLAMRPRVLVLDEPTANLDPVGSREVLRVVRRLLDEGDMTVIVIEHDAGPLLAEADRLVVMDAGRVIVTGPPREVIAKQGLSLLGLGIRLPAAAEFWLEAYGEGDWAPLAVDEVPFGELGPPIENPSSSPQSAEVEKRELVLDVSDVRFSYPDGLEVLQGVSLAVGSGEVLAVMGANGSGKSTLASLLVGLNRPSSGHIEVAGKNAHGLSIRELARNVGYVFQYPEHQFVTDRVVDEVAFSLLRLGTGPAATHERAREFVSRFDLDDVRDQHPLLLSMGQKRRLSIAAMAVYRPQILILDEPTFGQDRAHTGDLIEVIEELNADGVALLVITHDLQLAADICDRIVVLDSGRVTFDAAPVDLLALLEDEPRWGLWPIEEYRLWREVARRTPVSGFTASPSVLAGRVRKAVK